MKSKYLLLPAAAIISLAISASNVLLSVDGEFGETLTCSIDIPSLDVGEITQDIYNSLDLFYGDTDVDYKTIDYFNVTVTCNGQTNASLSSDSYTGNLDNAGGYELVLMNPDYGLSSTREQYEEGEEYFIPISPVDKYFFETGANAPQGHEFAIGLYVTDWNNLPSTFTFTQNLVLTLE